MDALESCRKDYSNLRMRIIEPAVKELREKTACCSTGRLVEQGGRSPGWCSFRIDPQGRLDI